MNKDLWAAADLQGILDHEDAEEVEDSEDGAAQDDSDSDVSSNLEDAVVM